MAKVPGVGSVGRVFEIFIPGAFLVLNLIAAFYLFTWKEPTDEEVAATCDEKLPDKLSAIGSPLFGTPTILIVLVPAGYLAGVVLRLLKTEKLDWLSGRVRGTLKWKKREKWWGHRYPYDQGLREITQALPKEVRDFYTSQWEGTLAWGVAEPWLEKMQAKETNDEKKEAIGKILEDHRKILKHQKPDIRVGDLESVFSEKVLCRKFKRKQFVNFYKVCLAADDPATGAELASGEALSRNVASMFWALVASLATLTLYLVSHWNRAELPLVATLWGLYFSAAGLILYNYRGLRAKEVEAVFAAAFQKRKQLRGDTLSAGTPNTPSR